MKKIDYQILFFVFIFLFAYFISYSSADPVGPTSILLMGNSSAPANASSQYNVSGGQVGYLNLTATAQTAKWKAFVGGVSGRFALADANGSTIYDWRIASVAGQVFATRNTSLIAWSSIVCANRSLLEWENYLMNHTGAYDNISRTFNYTTHTAFFVGSSSISANTCPSLATYVNSGAQLTNFQEVVLTDTTPATVNNSKIIYTTKIETQAVGFNGRPYDFQIIVPESGLPGNSILTPYYLYVELQ